jgi:hypothetical protein
MKPMFTYQQKIKPVFYLSAEDEASLIYQQKIMPVFIYQQEMKPVFIC